MSHPYQNILAPGSDSVSAELTGFAQRRSAGLLNRRAFATSLAAAGTLATAGALGCSESGTVPAISGSSSSGTTTPSVVNVLNFALNLEYFEANFYTFVTTGGGLQSGAQGMNPGTVTGGAKVTFVNPIVASVANQLATDEQEHVNFLINTIMSMGGTPISMPTINLAPAGTTAVTNDATFLAAARQFETVGISAYAGGAQYLTSTVAGLTYAAQILDTEAQHEGFLRELCITMGVTSGAVDSQDIAPTSTTVFNTNANGLNAVRTPSQVLQILYAAPGASGVVKGGYFPNGLNGAIVST